MPGPVLALSLVYTWLPSGLASAAPSLRYREIDPWVEITSCARLHVGVQLCCYRWWVTAHLAPLPPLEPPPERSWSSWPWSQQSPQPLTSARWSLCLVTPSLTSLSPCFPSLPCHNCPPLCSLKPAKASFSLPYPFGSSGLLATPR